MSWTMLEDSNGLDKYLVAQSKALIGAAHNMVLKHGKPGGPIWTLSDRLGQTTYQFDLQKHRSEDLVRPHGTQEHPGMRIPYRAADTVFLMERLEEAEWVLDGTWFCRGRWTMIRTWRRSLCAWIPQARSSGATPNWHYPRSCWRPSASCPVSVPAICIGTRPQRRAGQACLTPLRRPQPENISLGGNGRIMVDGHVSGMPAT